MPTYDYQCEANGAVLEVKHGMSETVSTWGQLCERMGISPGDTPLDSPVKKLATGGQVVRSGSLGKDNLPPCQTGGGCSGGACGF